MFTLLICLYLYSNYVLSATVISEEAINGNIKRTLMSRPNTTFIQQVMTWFLSFLKSVLVYKVLFIGILVVMIYTLYENDDVSPLQQTSSKARKKRTPKKGHSNQRQKYITGSFELKLSEKINQLDIEVEKGKIQQSQMIENEKSGTLQQQALLNVSLKHCSSPKGKWITEPLEPKVLGRGQKSDTEDSSARAESLWSNIIGSDPPKNGWTCIQYKNNLRYIYHPNPEKFNKQNDFPSSKMIKLSNSFIPLQNKRALWTHSKFYTPSELLALAKTCKYSYLQFKKLPDITMSKKKANLYRHHPAYNISVIHMVLRVTVIPDYRYTMNFSGIIAIFERIYRSLLEKASKSRTISYKDLRRVTSFNLLWSAYEMTAKHFLVRKFLEKYEWTFEELQNSQYSLIRELEQAIEGCKSLSDYTCIPLVNRGMDQVFYEWLSKRMKLMNVPFCHCLYISQLLISSKDVPLKLFLFWDIFDAFKLEISTRVRLTEGESLRDNSFLVGLDYYISQTYSNQYKGYLSGIYFELVGFIQLNFFENDRRYNISQSDEQYQVAIDDYMLYIRAQVEDFLINEVFSSSSVAIEI